MQTYLRPKTTFVGENDNQVIDFISEAYVKIQELGTGLVAVRKGSGDTIIVLQ